MATSAAGSRPCSCHWTPLQSRALPAGSRARTGPAPRREMPSLRRRGILAGSPQTKSIRCGGERSRLGLCYSASGGGPLRGVTRGGSSSVISPSARSLSSSFSSSSSAFSLPLWRPQRSLASLAEHSTESPTAPAAPAQSPAEAETEAKQEQENGVLAAAEPKAEGETRSSSSTSGSGSSLNGSVEGTALPAGSQAEGGAGAGAVGDLSAVTEWELDFCSRPLLDERGKRVWELLVCDASRLLHFAEFFPSNRINSATLRDAILRVCATTGAPKPQKIRFFRAQMQTIITKACAELDIQAVPSQRCVTLVRWLEERLESVYKQDPSYQSGAAPLLQLEPPPPQDLPDSLRGDQWVFVQLPLAGILEEAERVQEGQMFGSVLNLNAIGLGSLPPTTMIPGISVQSTRATPLAAWTSALELAHLRVDTSKACLLLSTGVTDTWRYAFYRKSSSADAEARAWEEAKRQCGGLHFLAVQRNLEEEECTGFWLLHDTSPPLF